MIVKPRFYYEYESLHHGDQAYFILRYAPMRLLRRLPAGLPELHWVQLTNLYVAPHLRWQGTGAKLLVALKDWQMKTNTNVVLLAANYQREKKGLDDDALHRFYNKWGFQQIAHTPYHYSLAEDPYLASY